MRRFVLIFVLAVSLNAIAESNISVTVYNQDLGLIRETRKFDFPKGVGEVRCVDVAARIIPTSVHFKSDAANLLEQNYEYDLLSAQKLMSKYIDHRVELTTDDDKLFIGTLLTAGGDIVMRELDGSVRSISRDKVADVHFPDLPEGLITRPTLVWLVDSRKAGKGEAEISYLTNGMSWESEYVAVSGKDDKTISLTGWINIDNKSGATYADARIKLMAGDVQVIPTKRRRSGRDYQELALSAQMAPQFEEQAFFEYHLYTLQRTATLRNNQIKQISLFPTADVKKVRKEYRYDRGQQRYGRKADDVKVTLIFKNTESNGLGIPLPKGKIRVYKEGPDGGLEFVGEDLIDHTPHNEEVRITTGNAFDVVGERKELEVTKRGREKLVEFRIRNHKPESVTVTVAERLWGDWQILEATPGWKKKSSTLVEWEIEVKPEEENVITYRVLYNK